EAGAERRHRERRRRDDAGDRGEQPGGEEEREHAGGDVGDQQPEVDAHGRLPKRGEHAGVHRVDSRELEVVCRRVGRDALEEELAEVRVLTLVAVEWYVEEAKPDRGG